MRIEYETLWARAVSPSDEERSWLVEYLTFEQARYANGRRVSPKVHRLFQVINNTMPAGLVSQVSSAAIKAGFDVQVQDVRSRPFFVPTIQDEDVAWLYDYQRRALDLVLQRTRGILWMPTGSGKTEVAIALGSIADEVDWLFLVHRKGLLGQTADRFEQRTGEEAGRIGEGRWAEKRFNVATFQTVSRALTSPDEEKRKRAKALLSRSRGLIVDECHVLPSDSFWRVAMRTINAHYRIGMSGTPLARGDRKSLMAVAALGSVIYRLKASKLVDAGVLARPTIRLLPVEQDSTKPTWQGVYGECIVRSTKRNSAVVDAVEQATKPCLVFVKELKHGRDLAARLSKAGIRVEFAQGKHSSTWRNNLIASLVRGDIDVLVTTVIMQEGVDIPSLESVVIASGGKSAIAALQRIGRGMRSDQGRKETFEVFDFDDRGHRWLERHTKERIKAYRSEGFEPEPAAACKTVALAQVTG